MLRRGDTEPKILEWARPVVFAPTTDGKLRFSVDYRKLIARTVRDTYPMPREDNCTDSLEDAKNLSTTDCNSGYWQTEILEANCNKTIFSTRHGLFRLIRMPPELKIVAPSFQRAVDIILSRVTRHFALVYLEDNISYSKLVTKNSAHVRSVAALLRNAVVALDFPGRFF